MSEQPNGQPAGRGGHDGRGDRNGQDDREDWGGRDGTEDRDGRRSGRWRHRSAVLAGSARGLPDQVPMVGRALRQLLRVNLLDSATRLAAQAFLSALPALFVVAVFTPAAIRDGVVHSLRTELGLEGPAAQSVQQMLGTGHEQETGFGVVGALVTLLSATALSRAMQRVCERCWELPKAGTRVAAWRWLVWLVVWLLCLAFQTPVKDGFGLGAWLGVPLTFLLATAMWWWTQHLLLGARVRWLPLLPGAVLCGVAVVGIGVASRIYLPGAMSRSIGQFGPFGVVFTGLSWLIVVFTGMTLAIALGRVVAEEEAVSRLLGSRTAPGQWGGPRF
ncbi:YhjD/YihY/BrkB family envelope integrity protein [Kitasatospora sp. NPDC015120]|uniref:YhjD/YihY/BrkB family envelope integrity protein n=1 Tax=Kitasatospora sp. NPDC015120 TaxID=3364023 RepID=UPI0036F49FAB